MRHQERTLFIYPPTSHMAIETPRPDGSLGLCYIAGELTRAGYQSEILDASLGGHEDSLEDTFYRTEELPGGLTRIGMSWEALARKITRVNPTIVGIHSNHTSQTKMALEVARIVKAINPEILVVVGGVSARALYERYMVTPWVDMVVTTEGERVMLEIVRRKEAGLSLGGIPGVISRLGITPPAAETFYRNLDDLPIPSWDMLSLDRYARVSSPHGQDLLGTEGIMYAPLQTSRGCPFQCVYCHISLERFGRGSLTGDVGELRLKSVPRVLEEVEVLRGLGVKKIFL